MRSGGGEPWAQRSFWLSGEAPTASLPAVVVAVVTLVVAAGASSWAKQTAPRSPG